MLHLRRYGGPYAVAVPMSARAMKMCVKKKMKKKAIVVALRIAMRVCCVFVYELMGKIGFGTKFMLEFGATLFNAISYLFIVRFWT